MFVIEAPFLKLDSIYTSKQNQLRWQKVRDNKYVIMFRDNSVKVEQSRDRLIFDCSEEEFYSIWFDYFDFKTDYLNANYDIRRLHENIKPIAVVSQGIRIIKQDIFETIIASIINSYNSPITCDYFVELVASQCGTKKVQSMKEIGKVRWYIFPSPEMVLNKLDKLKTFMNSKTLLKITNACHDIIHDRLNLKVLSELSYEDAEFYLNQFEWATDKIIKRICLYSLHHLETFPIGDKFISETESLVVEDFSDIDDLFVDNKKMYRGICYTYINSYRFKMLEELWKEKSDGASGQHKKAGKRE